MLLTALFLFLIELQCSQKSSAIREGGHLHPRPRSFAHPPRMNGTRLHLSADARAPLASMIKRSLLK